MSAVATTGAGAWGWGAVLRRGWRAGKSVSMAAAIAVAAALPAAVAQPASAPAAASALLPFVDAGGQLRKNLRHGDLLRELGDPPKARLVRAGSSQRAREEDLLLEYPDRGLSFRVVAKERPARDPLIAEMVVTPPSAAATTSGLSLGMPRADVEAVLRSRQRIDRLTQSSGGADSARLVVSPLEKGSGEGSAVYVFDKGRLASITFVSTRIDTATPWRSRRWVRQLTTLLALAALAFGLYWLFSKLGVRMPNRWGSRADRDPDRPTPIRDALGVLLLIGGVVIAMAGMGALRGTDPYGRWGGLIYLIAGAGGVMLALFVWSTSGRSWLRRGAGTLLIVGILAALAAKVIG